MKKKKLTVSVKISALQEIADMAKRGEGDILHMNNPEAARRQLAAIFFRVQALLPKTKA